MLGAISYRPGDDANVIRSVDSSDVEFDWHLPPAPDDDRYVTWPDDRPSADQVVRSLHDAGLALHHALRADVPIVAAVALAGAIDRIDLALRAVGAEAFSRVASGAASIVSGDSAHPPRGAVRSARRAAVGRHSVRTVLAPSRRVRRLVRRALTAAQQTLGPADSHRALHDLLAATSGNSSAVRAAQTHLARRLTARPDDDVARRALRLLCAAGTEGARAW